MNYDLLVIVVYLLFVVGVVSWIGAKINLEGFLVNSRKTPSFLLIFSVVSSTLGAGAIVGVAGAAYSTGISFGISTIVTVIVGFLLLAWIAPRIKEFGDKHNAYTIADFFAVRYSQRVRYIASFITIVAFFIFAGAQFVALASLLNILLEIDFILALVGSALLTLLYTVLAGLKGDIYTDFLQFLVITIAFVAALLPFGVLKIGIPTNLPVGHLSPFNFAGPVFFFGSIFLGGLWRLGAMEWWSRIYASRTPKEARKVFLWSTIIVIPFYLLPVGLGLIATSQLGAGVDPDQVLFKLMVKLLPSGLLGLGFAGLIAAIMSTVDGSIMVTATSALRDFYQPLVNPRAGLPHVRVFTILFGFLALASAYFVPDIVDLILFAIFALVGLIIPVMGGIFWRKAGEKAAFWSMTLSIVVLLIAVPFSFELAWVPSFITSIVVFVVMSLYEARPRKVF
jgi:solute:Na+ symporter, SSS family